LRRKRSPTLPAKGAKIPYTRPKEAPSHPHITSVKCMSLARAACMAKTACRSA